MQIITSALVALVLLALQPVVAEDEAPPKLSPDTLNRVCVKLAKNSGKENPQDWAWSPSGQTCVDITKPDTSARGSTDKCSPLLKDLDDWLVSIPEAVFHLHLPMAGYPKEVRTACQSLTQARVDGARARVQNDAAHIQNLDVCPEGYDECMDNCNNLPGGWKDGGPGARLGCRLNCQVFC